MAEEFQGLYVKFGADSVEFEKSIGGINKQLTLLKKDFQATNNALKFDPGNVDLLNTKMKNLQEQARLGELKIKELKASQDKLGDSEVGSSQWNKLALEIAKVENQMNIVKNASAATQKQIDNIGTSTAMQKLNNEIDATARDLEAVNAKLKLDPNSTSAAAQKMELLGKQASLAEQKVKQLQIEQTRLGVEKVGTDEWKSLQNQIEAAQQDVEIFHNELKGIDNTSASLDDISKKLNMSNLQKASQGFQDIGQGVLNFGQKSLQAFSEVDEGMDTVAAKSNLTADETDKLFTALNKEVPGTNFQAMGDAVGGLNQQFGLTGKSLETSSAQLLKFASINNTDVSSSIKGAQDSMALFNMDVSELPSVLDTVSGTAKSTGLSVDTIWSSVQKGAPALQEMGLNLNQSVSLLGQFEVAGINTKTASTGMQKAFVNAQKSGKTLGDAFKGLNSTLKSNASQTEKNNAIIDLFGAKAGPALVNALNSGKISLEDFTEAGSKAGSVTDTFNNMVDPIDKATAAQNESKMAMAELGSVVQESLSPVFDVLTSLLKSVADLFKRLPGPVKTVISVIGLLVAGFSIMAPAITAVATILPMLGAGAATAAAGTGVLSATLLPIIAIVAALVAGLTLFFTKTETGRKAWEKITTAFKNGLAAIQPVINLIKGVAVSAFSNFVGILGKVGGTISGFHANALTIVGVLTTIGTTILGVSGPFGLIIGLVAKFIAAFAQTHDVSSAIQMIVENITGMINAISTQAPKFIQIGTDLLISLINGITQALPKIVTVGTSIFTTVVNAILQALPQIITVGTQLLTSLVTAITQALPQIVQAVTQIITSLTSALTSALPLIITAGIAILMALIQGGIQALPQLIQAAVKAINALVKGLISVLPQLINAAIQIITALVDALIDNLPMLIDAAIQIILALVNGLIDALPQLIQAGIQLVVALVNGLIKALPQILTAIVKLITALTGAIITLVPLLIQAGIQIIGAVIQGLIQAGGQLLGAIGKVFAPVVTFFQNAWTGMVNFVTGIPGQIQSFFSGLATWFDANVWQPILNFFENLWNVAVNFVSGIPQTIQNFFNGVVSFFSGIFNNVAQVVSTGFSKAVAFAQGIPGQITGFFNNVGAFFSNLFNSVANVIQSAFNTAVSFVSGIPGRITGFFSSVGSTIGGYFQQAVSAAQSAFNGLVSFVTGIPGQIANAFSGIGSAITGAIGDLGSIGSGIVDSIVRGITGLGSAIRNVVKGAIGNIADFAKSILGLSAGGIGALGENIGFGGGFGGMVQQLYNVKAMGMPAVAAAGDSNVTNLNISVTANNASGQDMADMIERVLVRRLRGR